MDFVPLRLNSGFSYLRSGLSIEKMVSLAYKMGYKTIGICDYMNLNGFAPFSHTSEKYGIKPIFGMELELDGEIFCLFVKNETGYRNLLFIAYLASKGEMSLKTLIERKEGLNIVYDLGSSFLKNRVDDEISNVALELRDRLNGLNDAYLGLPFIPEEEKYISFVRRFSSEYGYEIVALPHICYAKKEDAIVTLITSAIQSHVILDKKEAKGNDYFLTKEEASLYYEEKEIELTNAIADSSFRLREKRGSLLKYENNEGLSSKDYLRMLAEKGLKDKGLSEKEEYKKRLDYELGVISSMGYDDYFLVVADYVNYAKRNDITVGPGRGSGPASLVSYCLNISSLDPIEHGLLFERFLNPSRSSMPDIDVDFPDSKRDLVVKYLQNKYGEERVGRVLTSQDILAKEALRDIGRVYGYADREISLIISNIEDDRLSLRDDYRYSKSFKKLIDSDKYYLNIVSLASKIEGLPRQAGIHAAGIILNNDPLYSALPVKYDPYLGLVGCLEKDYLEEQGFLKMDLLGLRNLSIIDNCLELIALKGEKLKIEDLPYDDEKAISLVKNHEVVGLFQLESSGMQRAIDQVKPSSFSDLVALIALYRPGPMSQIPTYGRRKNGLEKVTYLTPELEGILSSTYGVIIYQEQIMQITEKLAGFSLSEADLFRRAISKKNAEKLSSYKDKFVKGCISNGKSEELSLKVFDLIFAFANYGFNKAHAVSYAMLSSKMAYLKYYYPNEFYCSILTYLSASDPKFKNALNELKKRGIHLLLPSINEDREGYAVRGKGISFPLSSIKNIQSQFINKLHEERLLNGKYQDIFDLAIRNKKNGLNQQILIRLIDAGALDEFGYNRPSLRASAHAALEYAELNNGEDGMSILLNLGIEKPAMEIRDEEKEIDLKAEYEALGIVISSSPLSFYEEKIKSLGAKPLSECLNEREFLTYGIIKDFRSITNKKGERMAFIDIIDEVNEMSLVIFSEVYDKAYPYLKKDAPIVIKGYKGQKGYVADEIRPLSENI